MTSTASTASATPAPGPTPEPTLEPTLEPTQEPTPDPASSPAPIPAPHAAAEQDAGETGQEHDAGDATVTEQPAGSRFTDRAAARAAQVGGPEATPAPAATAAPAAEHTDGSGPTRSDEPAVRTRRVRRSPDVRAGARRAASVTKAGVNRLRTLLGEIVWIACLLAAAALLVGAALVVLEANTHNALVEGVLKAADWADLGVFSRTAGIKQFTGENAVIKNAVVNWGLGAVVWLVVGRIARRILTP